MSDDTNFYSGPHMLRREQQYASPNDISRIRQRMLNLEQIVKELKVEIENLKNK